MIEVKICGINSELAFDAAVQAGADWIGFVFFPGSPRYITPTKAQTLTSRSRSGPARVGLFVDPSLDDVRRALDAVDLNVLQLYCPAERLIEIKQIFNKQIWRPVGVSLISELPTREEVADRILVEAKPPKGATRPGGNSTTFDWRITSVWKSPVPWILAGGLSPTNVADAVALSGATAVDVSSGVEAVKGIKSPELIRQFIDAARKAPMGRRSP